MYIVLLWSAGEASHAVLMGRAVERVSARTRYWRTVMRIGPIVDVDSALRLFRYLRSLKTLSLYRLVYACKKFNVSPALLQWPEVKKPKSAKKKKTIGDIIK